MRTNHTSRKHRPTLHALRYISYIVLLIGGLQCQASAAEVQNLRFAHNGGPGSLYETCVNEYARRVNAKLPEGFALSPVGLGGLGDDMAVLEKVKRGDVTINLTSSIMPRISDKFAIFELPFLINDRVQMREVTQVLLNRYLQEEARKNGFRILAIWENGFRHLTNNTRPIKQPEDLRGLKIRIAKGGPWREKIFKMLGAEPVPMSVHETYDALKSGAVDGEENPLQQIKGMKFDEVQRYLTFSAHVYTPAYVLVGEEAFTKLPVAAQRALTTSAVEMQSWVEQAAIHLDSELVDDLEQKMQANQVNIRAFQAATRPLYGEFIRTVPDGAKMLELVTDITERTAVR